MGDKPIENVLRLSISAELVANYSPMQQMIAIITQPELGSVDA